MKQQWIHFRRSIESLPLISKIVLTVVCVAPGAILYSLLLLLAARAGTVETLLPILAEASPELLRLWGRTVVGEANAAEWIVSSTVFAAIYGGLLLFVLWAPKSSFRASTRKAA